MSTLRTHWLQSTVNDFIFDIALLADFKIPSLDPTSNGVVGDGVTNAEPGFITTLNKALASGIRTIKFPKGVYYFPLGITLTGITDLHITGENGTVFKCGVPTLNKHQINGLNCDNVTISNIEFESNDVVRTAAVFAVYFQDSTGIKVANCKMTNALSSVWYNHCFDSHMYRNLSINTKADGFHFSHGCRDCSAIENETRGAKDDHYSITTYVDTSIPANADGRAKRIRIINNIASGGTWGQGVAVYGADDIYIAGNTIKNVASNGIGVRGFVDPVANTNVTVIGNTIDGCATALKLPVSEATGGDPAGDPLVGESEVVGICLNGTTDSWVKDNVIKNVAGAAPAVQSGIAVVSTRRVTIHGNTFDSINGPGIWQTNGSSFTEDLQIVSNSFRNISDSFIFIQGATLGTVLSHGNVAIAPYGTGSGFGMRYNNNTCRLVVSNNIGSNAARNNQYTSNTNLLQFNNSPT